MATSWLGQKRGLGSVVPVVASAALALGFALGVWIGKEGQVAPETPGTVQTQEQLAVPDVQSRSIPQRRSKNH